MGIFPLPHFVYDFSRKVFLLLYYIKWPSFIVWLPLLLEIWGNNCIAIFFFSFWRQNFEVSLISLIMSFFCMTKKPRQKYEIWISWEQKELLRWNEKHFPSFLKGFQLKKCKKSSQSWVCVLKNSFYNVAPLKKIQNLLCLTFSFGCV